MDKSNGSDDISKMIESLMADEKFGEILASVKESFSTNANNKESSLDSKAEEHEQAVSTALPALSPEIMSKLPSIISMISGSSDDCESKTGTDLADRKCLLQALRPFLSQKRREAVDSILNVAGIADLLGL